MKELDRIFERDDMDARLLVDLVEHRGKCSRLAGTCGACAEDDTGLFLDHLFENRRQTQHLERRDFRGKLAHDDGAAAILAEDVDAKARLVGKSVARITRPIVPQIDSEPFVVPNQNIGEAFGLLRSEVGKQVRNFDRGEDAVEFDLRGLADDKKQVRSAFAAFLKHHLDYRVKRGGLGFHGYLGTKSERHATRAAQIDAGGMCEYN